VKLERAVWKSTLSGTLKPLMALIAFTVFDDDESARKKGKGSLTLYMTVREMVKQRGLHERAIRRQLRQLVARHLLTVEAPGGGRRRFGSRLAGAATVYRVHPDMLSSEPKAIRSKKAKQTLPEKEQVAGGATLAKSAGGCG
jgi:hypothetical protein